MGVTAVRHACNPADRAPPTGGTSLPVPPKCSKQRLAWADNLTPTTPGVDPAHGVLEGAKSLLVNSFAHLPIGDPAKEANEDRFDGFVQDGRKFGVDESVP